MSNLPYSFGTGTFLDKLFTSQLQADLDALATQVLDINTQPGTYTLALTDAGGLVEMNSGSANSLIVPPNASVPFVIGTFIRVVMLGSGQTTIVAGSGVTINTDVGLRMGGQYSWANLYKRATDQWIAYGDLKP